MKTYYSYGNFTLRLRVVDHEASEDEEIVTIQVRPSVAGTKYYITDHLGSVRSTVNHLGQVVGQEDFWSYGLTMPGRSWNNGNAYDRYKFTGHERDSEGGLDMDYMIARNYDPELGAMMSVDPLYFLFPSKSPYAYAFNNPINYTDPTGQSPTCPDSVSCDDVYETGSVVENDQGSWEYLGGGQWKDLSNGGTQDAGLLAASFLSRLRNGTINTTNRNWAGRISDGIDNLPLGSAVIKPFYNFADISYQLLTLQTTRVNLAGEVLSNSEVQNQLPEFLTSFMPIKVSNIKGLLPHFKTLNASQFSQTFKGSALLRLSPANRGFVNRVYNNVGGAYNKTIDKTPGTLLDELVEGLITF